MVPHAADPSARASASPPRGLLIVIDGGEGCGKSTQAKLLIERLRAEGRHTLAVRDPGSTRVSELIRAILLNPDNDEMGMRCEMLLYMAARAQMMQELIQPALDAGKIVVCDRFVSSTLAYQLGGDGLTADEIRAVAAVALRGVQPDLVILLDMPVEKSSARVQRARDRIEQRPNAYHEKVRLNYIAQAKAQPKLCKLIDAHRDHVTVAEDVWRQVQKVLGG
jgi:dTMP kinase